ncbi:hypothetical protein MT391_18555 [Vibrio sp. 1-Bac 57]
MLKDKKPKECNHPDELIAQEGIKASVESMKVDREQTKEIVIQAYDLQTIKNSHCLPRNSINTSHYKYVTYFKME